MLALLVVIPLLPSGILLFGYAHNLFIHFPVDGHLGHSHFGAIMNRAVMNIRVQVLAWT